jgi:hypothetical protein
VDRAAVSRQHSRHKHYSEDENSRHGGQRVLAQVASVHGKNRRKFRDVAEENISDRRERQLSDKLFHSVCSWFI